MLLEGAAAEQGIELLSASDFYRETHQTIFDVISTLVGRSEPVDLTTVQNELRKRDKFDMIGGISYLTSLFNSEFTPLYLPHYAQIVAVNAYARRVGSAGIEIFGLSREPITNVEDLQDRIEQIIYGLRRDRASKIGQTLGEIVSKIYDQSVLNAESGTIMLGLGSGFPDIDRFTNGIRKKNLIVIGARPSVGKTSLVTQIALHIAVKLHEPVLFISIEMSEEDIGLRCLSSMTQVESTKLVTGKLSAPDWQLFCDTAEIMQVAPFRIVAEIDTVSEIRAVTRRFIKEYGSCGLVVVDYLQLMASKEKIENRTQEVGDFAKSLKAMAKSLNTTVVVLSQLTRLAETREPTKADLRESGDIEAVADVIFLLHRPRVGKGEILPKCEPTTVIVDKNRNGPKGRFTLGFLAETATYVSPAFDLVAPGEKTPF